MEDGLMFKRYQYVEGIEYVSMKELIKIMEWLYKVDEEVFTNNDKCVMLKIVSIMLEIDGKELKNISFDEIQDGLGLDIEDVKDSVWWMVNRGFFREINKEKRSETDMLHLVYSNLHVAEVVYETVA